MSGTTAGLWRDFGAMLTSLRTSPVERPDFTIRVTEMAALPHFSGGSLVFDGEVPIDGRCRMVRDANGIHLVFPQLQTLSISGDSAEIHVITGTWVNWTVWMLALDAALDAGRQNVLHMAGLTLPGSDLAVLIHASSGTGKTTTSLALALEGFGLCSDDAMVIGFAADTVSAWGLPRHVKVHRNTAAMMPSLATALGADWDRNGEQAVALDQLSGVVRVEEPRGRTVAGLFHLARSSDALTRLSAMSRTDAMVSLAADNVRTSMAGLLPSQQRRMAAIARLVSSVPTYRLETGEHPSDAAAMIESALGGRRL